MEQHEPSNKPLTIFDGPVVVLILSPEKEGVMKKVCFRLQGIWKRLVYSQVR